MNYSTPLCYFCHSLMAEVIGPDCSQPAYYCRKCHPVKKEITEINYFGLTLVCVVFFFLGGLTQYFLR